MKISEVHSNGSKIEVTGSRRQVLEILSEWRASQTPKQENEKNEPKVKGVSAQVERQSRMDPGMEEWTVGKKIPIVFGFQPNRTEDIQ